MSGKFRKSLSENISVFLFEIHFADFVSAVFLFFHFGIIFRLPTLEDEATFGAEVFYF